MLFAMLMLTVENISNTSAPGHFLYLMRREIIKGVLIKAPSLSVPAQLRNVFSSHAGCLSVPIAHFAHLGMAARLTKPVLLLS